MNTLDNIRVLFIALLNLFFLVTKPVVYNWKVIVAFAEVEKALQNFKQTDNVHGNLFLKYANGLHFVVSLSKDSRRYDVTFSVKSTSITFIKFGLMWSYHISDKNMVEVSLKLGSNLNSLFKKIVCNDKRKQYIGMVLEHADFGRNNWQRTKPQLAWVRELTNAEMYKYIQDEDWLSLLNNKYVKVVYGTLSEIRQQLFQYFTEVRNEKPVDADAIVDHLIAMSARMIGSTNSSQKDVMNIIKLSIQTQKDVEHKEKIELMTEEYDVEEPDD